MFSVSAEIYEILSLALRYVFALCGLLIVLRAFRWLLADRRETRSRLRHLPDAGNIGDLVVLAGSGELAPGMVLPVPREGVLGSRRACDVVIPCPGVRGRHLDFSWQDGIGLLLRPRSGCEAVVDQQPVNCQSDPLRAPLCHGSCLRVGEAVLRLRVFAGLDFSAESLPADPAAGSLSADAAQPSFGMPLPPDPGAVSFPAFDPASGPVEPFVPDSAPAAPQPAAPAEPSAAPDLPSDTPPERDAPSAPAPASPGRPPRRRRSQRWKEDWSE